ncbi:MAG: hypothetical protein LBH49_03865 [Puniceicoccales bacterium]|nr:hypothetical protein [Puniceicoccales bacterium]
MSAKGSSFLFRNSIQKFRKFFLDWDLIENTLLSIDMEFKMNRSLDGIVKRQAYGQVGNARTTSAMTLMEILIVIALIAVLAGVSVTNLGGILGSNKAKIAETFLKGEVKNAVYAVYASNDGKVDKEGLEKHIGTNLTDPWGGNWEVSDDGSSRRSVTIKSTATGLSESTVIGATYSVNGDGQINIEFIKATAS